MQDKVSTIYPEEPCKIPIKFDENPLEAYEKDYSDIENVVICFKNKPSEPIDKYLALYQKDEENATTGSVLIDEQQNIFTAIKSDQDVLPVNSKGYRMFIGVKVQGYSKMLWLRVDEECKVKVEEDGIQETEPETA